jgi:hypothetical protein
MSPVTDAQDERIVAFFDNIAHRPLPGTARRYLWCHVAGQPCSTPGARGRDPDRAARGLNLDPATLARACNNRVGCLLKPRRFGLRLEGIRQYAVHLN